MKKKMAPEIMEICREFGMKASLAVRHHSTLVLNIQAGSIDFLTDYNARAEAAWRDNGYGDFTPATHIRVNEYHIDKNYSGQALTFLKRAYRAMMKGNHDRSDTMTDYFDVGWYVDINIGQYDRPYR